MKLLLDQGIPRGAVALLQQEGHDAVHVGDIGFEAADDPLILERARAEQRFVVTLDADFHALMAVSGAVQPSVSRIRIEGLRSLELAAALSNVLQSFEAELAEGALVTVRRTRTRFRRLPLSAKRA